MRAFGAFAFFVLLVSQASAQQMMRPGTEPEDGFKGTWRFIGAQVAPWAKPRALTKADAPLLEFAIKLKNGAVEGPPPFSCKSAAYTEGVSYHDDLFGGKLKGDKDFALARKIGLSQGEIDTERVICNGRTFDFYFTDNAQWLLGMDDVIYTLEQPAGMDPEQYSTGYNGPSFDCTQAKATGDRLICMDAQLSKLDRKLGAEYAGFKKALTPESFATFQTGERAWLAFVMKTCGADVPMPDEVGDRNSIIDCLQTKYSNRADLFDGIRPARFGALLIEPRLRFRTRATPDTEESDIYPVMSGGPQAAPFNAYIAKALKLDKWRMDDKSLFQYDDVDDMQLFAQRFFTVARFDDRIVSLRIGTDDFTGGHGDWMSSAGLTWDMQAAKPVLLADVFANNGWKALVAKYCLANLQKQSGGDNLAVDLDSTDIANRSAKDANWLWGKDKATVMFDLAVQQSIDDEGLDVEIPYSLLKPYLKPDAPILAK